MANQPPPVPPAGRSTKDPNPAPSPAKGATPTGRSDAPPANLKEQGDQANIQQNTRNQGYQQDR